MMIDHLTARGVMDPRLLYESPFTDIDPLGVAGVFKEGEVVQLIQILRGRAGKGGGMTSVKRYAQAHDCGPPFIALERMKLTSVMSEKSVTDLNHS